MEEQKIEEEKKEMCGSENTKQSMQGENSCSSPALKTSFVAIVPAALFPYTRSTSESEEELTRSTSGSEEELTIPVQRIGSIERESPVRPLSALKGASPGRKSTTLSVHFDAKLDVILEGGNEREGGNENEREGGNENEREIPPFVNASMTSSFRLLCAACETPLGKFGMVVMLLGCIGFAAATYGATLSYGPAVLIIAGVTALGISVFHSRCSQVLSVARDEKAEIRQQIW